MSEIKFRVWTGIEMEYRVVVGQLGTFYVEGLDPKDTACMSPNNTIYPKECSVMQYTGLKDKNGKEIFEGDIVRSECYGVEEMKWHLDLGGFFFWGGDPVGFRCKFHHYPHNYEIIGNIYENPELIKNGVNNE